MVGSKRPEDISQDKKIKARPPRLWAKLSCQLISLVIPHRVQSQLAELATISGESCGVIIGHVDDNRIIVTEISSWNKVGETKSFRLPVSFFFDSINQHRKKGGQDLLLGIFHTHPGGETALSEGDLAYAKLYNWIWLIASPVQNKTLFSAYASIDQNVSQIPVEL